MNAKKKNKKANKPPNPNPPQKVDSAPKKEEKVEETQPKCEVTQEILSLEVPSEVSVIPVSEVKDVESETPKKPKRNKGKNKQQGKEEEKVEVKEKPQEVQKEVITVNEESQNIAAEVQQETKDPLDEATVVPSARKKKNKKKPHEKTTEEPKQPVDDTPISTEETITIEPIVKIDTEIQELFSAKPEAPKDAKKKKNKKKNRTDSERSDKSDSAVSCTTAFQKILSEDSSFKQEQSNIVTEVKREEETDTRLGSENNKQEIMNVDTLIPANTEETKFSTENIKEVAMDPAELVELPVELAEIKQIPKEENKGKKKNKKEKRQQHQETIAAPQHDVSEETPNLIDVLTENIIPDEPKQDVKDSVQLALDTTIEKEQSPKPKPKIAKPVEKKRKGKQDSQLSENLLNIVSSDKIVEDKKVDELPIQSELVLEEIPLVNITDLQVEAPTTEQSVTTPIPMENISVPSDHAMGKKRKKSPKPQKKNKEASNVKLEIESEVPTIKSESVPEIKAPPEEVLVCQSETQVAISDLTDMSTKSPDALPEMQIPEKEQEADLTEPKLLERPLTPETKGTNEGFEIKTNKKKKKSHKVPQDQTTTDITEPAIIPLAETQITAEKEQKPKQIKKENVDESHLSCDTEVRSARTESEASSCDLIPEVHFVRSSSQQLLDSNNNTVIQELIGVDDLKLTDPLLMPLIQGSGETPACTPDLVTSGIRMTEIETKSPTEEKTDIKSKMMEVNQDMEELRLSIERSLAEFTALEKCEKESPVKDNKNEQKPAEEIKLFPEIKENIPLAVDTKQPEKASPILPEEEVPKAIDTPPVCPARKDNKGKGKSKKKGKQESTPTTATTTTPSTEPTTSQSKDSAKDEKKEKSEEKSEKKSDSSQAKGKQQSTAANDNDDTGHTSNNTEYEKNPTNSEVVPDKAEHFEPIENFEDALTSSIDDVNKTFEIIAKDADDDNIEFQKKLAANKPEINIIEPSEEKDTNRNEKINPVSQPKNLLGHTDIPVQSSRTDYKKEKNKTPNARQARVKIKDSSDIETKKQSKESQTDNKGSRKNSDKSVKESFSRVNNDNEEYVYKYSFRKVFLQSACHVCNKDLGQVRVPCGYCNLIFYCGTKHKDEDWTQHQALCFAVSTLAHMKDQKHVYADAQHCTGQDYRLLRMQMIVSCEKVLKRRLVPWEQELMLYPRICAEVDCREWRQTKLKDCDGCGQLSFCAGKPEHLPKAHARWCKSYSLYQRLVSYQQTKGRLEPRLPTRVMTEDHMPGKMNEVLASMYEEKIDMNDIQYASLTQLATAPLTTAYCLQLCRSASGITNGLSKKRPFTIHVVGAELQFEADALNKWETFFLHMRPDVDELKVVLVSPALNPGNLPLDLLGKIKLCDNCQHNKRRVVFKFEDNKNYFEYRTSEDFINPDIICAFNPSIQRSSVYNGKDPWPASINAILKLKTPFVITSYTLNELRKDIARIKQVSELDFKFISEPSFNSFASVRPDRNFISDDEMPLLFKNYCVAVVVGC